MNVTELNLNVLPWLSSLKEALNIDACEVEERTTKEKRKVGLYLDPSEFPKTVVYAILNIYNRHYVLGRLICLAVTKIAEHSKYSLDAIDVNDKQKQFYFENAQRLKPVLFVDDLWSPGREFFKNIGKSLLDYAKKHAESGECEGRLMLEAAYISHGFYYKNNLRVMVKVINWSSSEVDQLIEKTSPNTNYLGQVLMYLPKREKNV